MIDHQRPQGEEAESSKCPLFVCRRERAAIRLSVLDAVVNADLQSENVRDLKIGMQLLPLGIIRRRSSSKKLEKCVKMALKLSDGGLM